jgi:three-Cys-motif partner protein
MNASPYRPRTCEDEDHLYLPEIKRHSLEKIEVHNRYAALFAKAMRGRWRHLVYVGLYAGAGRARVLPTNEVVETSALSVLRQSSPFTKYIFVESDGHCAHALRRRATAANPGADVSVVSRDVNASTTEVLRLMPRYSPSEGVLSFCFVDPFDLQLRFETIRAFSHLRMDFLILLMVGVDARRNFRRYLSDGTSTRIADFFDAPSWRSEYQQSGDRNIIRFLARKFDEAMTRLSYLSQPAERHGVNAYGTGVLQYVLAFYSKDQLGLKFWREVRSGASSQLGFDLDDLSRE